MGSGAVRSLADSFIEQLLSKEATVTITTLADWEGKARTFTGKIKSHDPDSLVIELTAEQHALVFKHAIVSIYETPPPGVRTVPFAFG